MEVIRALDTCATDKTIRAVLLTGEGRAFCAGQDLAEAIAPGTRIEEILTTQYNPIVRRIRALPKPVVAAVNGVAAGAGANIAFACDLTLAAESATRDGPVPDTLPDALRTAATFAIAADGFLLKLPSGLKFLYRQGQAVTVERPENVPESDVPLFLNGSVYGAIAWINGLVPLHASGVVHDGRVHAFTGHSGAGKSTLAAGLSARGLPIMADDVLVLDMSDPADVKCLPGHKQLKLWKDAVEMVGAATKHQVREQIDKFFIEPASPYYPEPLPLAELYLLTDNSKTEATFVPVQGMERFTQARAAFYRPHLCNAIADRQDLFGLLSRLAAKVPITKFDRPRDRKLYADGVSAMLARITAQELAAVRG